MTKITAKTAERCPNRNQHAAAPEGYVAAYDWAQTMMRTHVQKQCAGCGLWLIWEPKATAPSDGQSVASTTASAPVETP